MVENSPHIEVSQIPGETETSTWQSVIAIELTSIPTVGQIDHSFTDQTNQTLSIMGDLVNSLYQPSPDCVFAIRFITFPNPNSFSAGTIDIVLFGKIISDNPESARERGLLLQRQILMQLCGLLPNYHWKLVTDPTRFQHFWSPFDWETAHFLEIRRREERIQLDTIQPRGLSAFLYKPRRKTLP